MPETNQGATIEWFNGLDLGDLVKVESQRRGEIRTEFDRISRRTEDGRLYAESGLCWQVYEDQEGRKFIDKFPRSPIVFRLCPATEDDRRALAEMTAEERTYCRDLLRTELPNRDHEAIMARWAGRESSLLSKLEDLRRTAEKIREAERRKAALEVEI